MAATPTFLDAPTNPTQDTSFYTLSLGTTGSVTSDTGNTHGQPRSIKLASGANGSLVTISLPANVLADAGGQFTVWVDTSSLVANQQIIQVQQSAGAVVFGLALNGVGALNIVNSTPAVLGTAGAIALQTNTYVRVSVGFVITSTTTYTINVYIEGILDAHAVNSTALVHVTSNKLQLGMAVAGQTGQFMWFSDIYVQTGVATAADIGDIRCTHKRPFANGTTNGFTTQIGSGGSGYGTGHAPQVNEQPLNNANGWSMVGAGSAVTEEYTIEGASVGDSDVSHVTIVALMGWINAKSLSSETGSMVLAGATHNATLTSTEANHFIAVAASVFPGGGTDIGFVTTTALTTVSLYECGIVVAYLAPDILLGQAVC